MPLFVFIGHDGPEGPERRNANRARHLEYLETLHRDGRLAYGGPMRDESGRSIGAVLVFDAPDLTSACTMIEQDPYVWGGVYTRHEIRPFVRVFPR